MAERKFYRKIFQKNGSKTFFFFRALAAASLFFLLAGFLFFLYYTKAFPRPEVFAERRITQSTKIYDRTGEVLLYEIYGEEKRTWVPLSGIPDSLKEAVIATEDANFYRHWGIDLKGIARAILADFKIGSPTYGGSTIPQQLIRSTFLSNKKTAERKIREIISAMELDRRYSKDQILEWYLNQIPFGQNAYGVQAASQTYFEKPVSEISLQEAAILAALIQAPSFLSPYGENKDRLLARKDYVLNRLVKTGSIDKETAKIAQQADLKFSEKPIRLKAPYFTLWVKQQLEEKYGEDFLRKGGLKVYTSLNWEMQEIAEKATKEGVEKNRSAHVYNAGMVAINPKTGEILAMAVGTGDYNASPYPEGCVSGKNCLFDPKFNVVVGTKENPGRQPGSSFKPFVYATALEKGYTDAYVVQDEPTNFGKWGDQNYEPQNYDLKFRGPVTLRNSLAQSLNVPSVKVLLDLAGLQDSVKTAENLGITTLRPPYGPSIVLGGWEVKLLEMTSAYGVFASGGVRLGPASILKIEDEKGNIIFKNKKDPKRVLESSVADTITSILSDNDARTPIFGPASTLYFKDRQVAVKTGTTQNYRDAWAIGYTPEIVVGAWAGNNDNTPTEKPGIMLAAPIWRQFLENALLKLRAGN